MAVAIQERLKRYRCAYNLLHPHFAAFDAFAEVEDVLVVADGFHGRLAFAFQGEVY